jgi:hypothetical protein
VQLTQGMRIEFWLISQYAFLDPVANQNYTADAYVIDIRETSFSNELEVAPLLPDMTQFDYVKSVVTAFNLKFSVDPVRRVVRFDTFDNFYRNNQFARNWTALGSDSQTPSRPVPFYQSSVLRWSNDESDALLTRFGFLNFKVITKMSQYMRFVQRRSLRWVAFRLPMNGNTSSEALQAPRLPIR